MSKVNKGEDVEVIEVTQVTEGLGKCKGVDPAENEKDKDKSEEEEKLIECKNEKEVGAEEKNCEGDTEAQLNPEANLEDTSTKVSAKKLFNEACHFRDHFSWKAFILGLFLGLIPSGWDTFSDFAFAAKDHTSTIELINATETFIYSHFPNGTISKTFTNEKSMPIAQSYNPTVRANQTQIWQETAHWTTYWTLNNGTIRTLTYVIITLPAILTIMRWFLNVDFLKMCNRQKTTMNMGIEVSVKIVAGILAHVGLAVLLMIDKDTESGPIFFSLALLSAAIVIAVKFLALFVHGPEMKKLSLRATLAESSNESTMQLIFVAIISLWSRETTNAGLMSMISSIVMIGKASAESYLTFDSKNELKGVSVCRHICLLATVAPAFILTAVFRVGSFAVLTAWNWYIGLMIAPLACCMFIIPLAILKYLGHEIKRTFCSEPENQQPVNHYLSDLSAGDVFHSYIAELSTTSNWGDRGREKSRKPQLFTALFFLLLYSPLILQIINSTGNNWVDPPITYHPDPATLRSCGIASLCSGWVGFALQILLPKIPLLHS